MHPVVSLIAEHVVTYHQLFAPLLFSVFATVGNVHTPVQHALFVTAISWLVVWVPAVLRVGIYSHSHGGKRSTSWLAGVLLGFSHICDRAACDNEGIWTSKALLPVLVVLTSHTALLTKHFALPTFTNTDSLAAETKIPSEPTTNYKSYSLLAALTVSASAVLTIFTVPTTLVLGLSSVIFAATGFVLIGRILQDVADHNDDSRRELMSANNDSPRRTLTSGSLREQQLAALRDVAATIILVCGFATFLMEPSVTSSMISWEPAYRVYNMDWREVHNYRVLQQVLWTIPANVIRNALTFVVILQQNVVPFSLLTLLTYLCAKLYLASSFSNIWFTVIYGSSTLMFLFGSPSSSSFIDMRSSARFKRMILGVTALSVTFFILRDTTPLQQSQARNTGSTIPVLSPISPLGPAPIDLAKGHPAAQLVHAAETSFQNTLSRQSKSLAAAVQEYRRRYGIAPPPHFDKWYEFATRNGVVLIDEFDTISQMLLPFWAVKPATIRSRITNALGHEDSALIAIAIRHGAVENFENGQEWQQQATIGMMKEFVQYLPDMDLGFNMHDEPRVVVPNNLLSSMIAKAKDNVLPRMAKTTVPRNTFSDRPADLNDGTRFIETSTTKFNRFAHQQTWTHSRLSCSSETQAQTFEDYAADNLTAFAAGPLNYTYNATAFSDICNSPSLSSTYGFFERPNAFSITHELTPIFSQSKISSFQDILYPSPWYWAGKVGYDETHDTTWSNKTNSLYWRGSTTGGFSRNGGWRRQHRQHIVRRLNAPDKAQVLTPDYGRATSNTASETYSVAEIERRSLKHLIDVKFSHIGQCDPGDCDAQKEFFKITERVDGQDAWYHKHLLDMDGNAFSGRFYSFLKSRSLTYKMAVFREWHSEWLQPWAHYIPLSLRGDEHLDLVKWFAGDGATEKDGSVKDRETADKGGNGNSLGERKAREIAQRSTDWHDKVLRNVDFEAWFFRLLLEYGRIIDDNREQIGYPGP